VHTTRNIVWDVLAATWSPTGRRLAVVQGAGSQIKRTKLEVVDVRTRRIRVVAASLPGGLLDRPAFSPDERRVAYVTSKATYMLPDEPYRYDADEQVFVVGTSGRGRRQVTHELPSGRYAEIVWTRGGIVYSTAQYGNDLELYTIEADGSGLTQLTRDLVDETFPAWSSDGTKIAFVRSNAETSWPLVAKPGVYVLDVARRTERRIVATTRYDRDAAPAWAPDGSALALVYRGRLGIARPDGTQLGLFQTLGRPQHPTWSPDATQLAFSDDEPGAGTAIYTINRDGTNLKAISRLAYANDPAWSPDGEWIAYEGQRGNGPPFGLWVVHPDGSGERMIAEGAVQGAPSWSPDGSELVYSLGGELHVVRLDGTGDRVLLAAPGNELADPSWH
jgi:TolB protein